MIAYLILDSLLLAFRLAVLDGFDGGLRGLGNKLLGIGEGCHQIVLQGFHSFVVLGGDDILLLNGLYLLEILLIVRGKLGRIDLVVRDIVLELPVCCGSELSFQVPFLGGRHVLAVGFFCLADYAVGDVDLEGNRESIDRVVHLGRLRIGNLILYLFREQIHDIPEDRVSELLLGQAYDLLKRHVGFSVLVESQFFRIVMPHKHFGFLLGYGIHLGENLVQRICCGEYPADVLEQEVGHESVIHDFLRMDVPRDGEDAFGIQLDHLAIVVLSDDREEVQ